MLAACFVWALRVAYKTIKADADSFRSAHPGLVGTAAKEGVFVSLGVNLLWVVTDEGAHLGVLRASAVALALVYISVRLFFAALPTIAKRYRTTGVFDIRVLTAVATVVLAFSMIYQQGGLREGNAAAGGGTFVYFSVVTLTTLGYGDVLPTEPMRFFACAEALVGYVLLGGIASLLFQIADSERTGGAPAARGYTSASGGDASSRVATFRAHHADMVTRIWHGWTAPENSDRYEQLLRTEIFAGIVGRAIPGFRDIQLLRREAATEVEFVTVMRFDSLDAVRAFAGADYEAAVVPPSARALLARFDARSAHYEVREEQSGRPAA
ncbi:hypothetical protein tb265_05680 [Gemmatimonadetes bacterium T265]|nr:hypothetical protein tb265_05680 [Gemmatimonadetes bacterium T265]